MRIRIENSVAIDENNNLVPDGEYELTKPRRTTSQNSSLHRWLSLVAEDANEKGLTLDKLYIAPQNMRITEHFLKDLFREYGRVMFGKDSTAKLTTAEMTKLVSVFEQVFAERLDCTIKFPTL